MPLMQNGMLDAVRMASAAMLALVASAMYSTGFFYTDAWIILTAFFVSLTVMFAPVPLGFAARPKWWLVAYSAGFALALTLAIPAVHFLWGEPEDLPSFVEDLFSATFLEVTLPVVALLFGAIVGTGLLTPVRSKSQR
jgi:hypothetical protein